MPGWDGGFDDLGAHRGRCTDRMRAIVADDNTSAQTYGMQRNTANASVAPAAEPVVLGGLGLGLRRQWAGFS